MPHYLNKAKQCVGEYKVSTGNPGCLTIQYKINGKEIDYFPADAPTLELVEPIYTDIPYIADLSKEEWAKLQGKSKTDLPESIQSYIKFIEDFVEIPITILSHGPERNETIVF